MHSKNSRLRFLYHHGRLRTKFG